MFSLATFKLFALSEARQLGASIGDEEPDRTVADDMPGQPGLELGEDSLGFSLIALGGGF